ncbi:MAG: response regulator [Sneathiella sp.]|nr:response regulator [Sneathiella sp.]
MNRPDIRIMIVEDNIPLQFVLKKILSNRGYNIICVDNGLKALDYQKESPVDLIFMDVSMPVMDGLTSTRKIRRLPKPSAVVPIIALTAHHLKEHKAECLAAGMDDYLVKPTKATELIDKINCWAKPFDGTDNKH